MAVRTSDKIPVTVLTGYLGAGKTTLLNQILSERHGRKFAVIVNEFGEIGVDGDLIVGIDEDIIEMNNGCVCCTVRGDLVRIIERLMQRPDGFDGIIVETTGLADPVPVAQTFFMDPDVHARTTLDAIVTVADAKWLNTRLNDAPQAKNQIAFADVILINKTDLVDQAELHAIEARIRGINPYAKLHRTERALVPIREVIGRNAFDLERILDVDPAFLDAHGHERHGHAHGSHGGVDVHHAHDEEVRSVAIRTAKPVDPFKFFPWVQDVVATLGPDLLRCKGILAFVDEPRRFVFHGIHTVLDGDYQRPWAADEKRETRAVFIGRNLPEAQIRETFEECLDGEVDAPAARG